MKKVGIIIALACLGVLSGCSSKNMDTYSTANEEAKLSESSSREKEKMEESAEISSNESKSEESSSAVQVKPSGFIIDLKGTGDQEAVHVVAPEEEGVYDVECYYIPYPENFSEYPDYQDLSCFVSVFPDGKKYDITMDDDKSVYNTQLTSPAYISELHEHNIKPFKGGGFTYTGSSVELKSGYQIMVLGGSVKFTKE